MDSTVPSTWMDISFNTTLWNSYSYPNSLQSIGNQFFRITIPGKGLTTSVFPPAYLAKFRYSEGIVVYINGKEVFRDNMPDGSLSPISSPISHYSTIDYRGYVRTAMDLYASTLVVAVGLFFSNQTIHTIDFDGYFQDLGQSVYSTAFPITEDLSISSSSEDCSIGIADHSLHTGCILQRNDYIEITLPESIIYQVTGFEMSFSTPTEGFLPDTIVVTGYDSIEHTDGYEITTFGGTPFTPSIPFTVTTIGYLHSGYRKYRLTFTSIDLLITNYTLMEIYPLVSFTSPPTSIPYQTTSFSIRVGIDSIEGKPLLGDFHECFVFPSLPQGLRFNTNDCSFSGYPFVLEETTVFTIMSNRPISSSIITLHSTFCEGTTIHMKMSIPEYCYRQMTVTIRNSTSSILWYYDSFMRMENEQYLCIKENSIQIEYGSEYEKDWQPNSLFTIWIVSKDQEIEVYNGYYSIALGTPKQEILTFNLVIPPKSYWQTITSIDNLPTEWYKTNQNWPSDFYPFPIPQSSYQLYQKSFYISSIESLSTIHIGIRFRFGCIVYLNGYLIFQQGVNTTIPLSPSVQPSYDMGEPLFVETSIPYQLHEGRTTIDHIVIGMNLLSIVLITPSNYHQSDFDCFVYLNKQSRSLQNIHYHAYTDDCFYWNAINCTNTLTPECFQYLSSDCQDNYAFSLDPDLFSLHQDNMNDSLILQFDHYQRVYLNHLAFTSSKFSICIDEFCDIVYGPNHFKLYGYNPGEESIDLLYSTENIGYWLVGQVKNIRFPLRKAYNTYIFTEFTNKYSLIQLSIGLFTEEQSLSTLCSFRDVVSYALYNLPEVSPDCPNYRDFSLNSPLPSGLEIDSATGIIYGKPQFLFPRKKYIISCYYYSGTSSIHANIYITVESCIEQGRIGITLDVYVSSDPTQQGIIVEGPSFYWKRSYLAIQYRVTMDWDLCLKPDDYTVSFITREYGWDPVADYVIYITDASFVYSFGIIGYQRNTTVQVPLFLKAPLLPRHINWKYLVSESLPSNWYDASYDCSSWHETIFDHFNPLPNQRVFLRTNWYVSSIHNETVLYLTIFCRGGIIAYLNGIRIARYYLESSGNSYIITSDALSNQTIHITIPLHRVDYHVGNNILAIEIYPPKQIKSEVYADCLGLYSYDEYAMLIDDIENSFIGTPSSYSSGYPVFDHRYRDYYDWEFSRYSFFEFTFTNREFVMFNYFKMLVDYSSTYSWLFKGGYSTEEYVYDLFRGSFLPMDFLLTSYTYTPVGMLPYNKYRFMIDSSTNESIVILYECVLYYRTQTEGKCEEDDWPFVFNLEYSVKPCDENYEGMKYRVCLNGQLGPVISTSCVLHETTYFAYDKAIHLTKNVRTEDIKPNYNSMLFYFYITPALPKGLEMNSETGVITGAAEDVLSQSFTVIGVNERSMIQTEFVLIVNNTACYDNDGIPYPIGSTRNSQCSDSGSYIGFVKEKCSIENGNVRWINEESYCIMTVSLITVSLFAVFIIIVIVVLIYRIVNFNDQEESSIRDLQERKKRIQEHYVRSKV